MKNKRFTSICLPNRNVWIKMWDKYCGTIMFCVLMYQTINFLYVLLNVIKVGLNSDSVIFFVLDIIVSSDVLFYRSHYLKASS